MAVEPQRPTRTRSVLVGALLAVIGILIGLGSILVLNRVDGDLQGTILAGSRMKAEWPAWLAVTFLVGIGLLTVLAGVGVAVIGWRAAEPRQKKPRRRAAFLVIKSAEGRRSTRRQSITPEELERQRDALAAAGIRRIEPAFGRDRRAAGDSEPSWGP